ncbi:hypothetical protein [Bradyrhizobium sp.]|uniref:hypothetical protein n=1 Tax=Bradyrhizobium sp. TaxID=376 RepID=UPI002D3CB69C|nr:hypothetical protein [Bradyrhizobium sp.]HZR73824.1 hypothetical protein [Bradyrhizobium sp.]
MRYKDRIKARPPNTTGFYTFLMRGDSEPSRIPMAFSAHHHHWVREEATAAATMMNIAYQNERLLKQQFRRLPFACREVLDAFVSGRMQNAVSAAKHIRPHGSRPPSDQAKTPAVKFGPLDPNVVSESIPAFFIGRNTDGLWVAREANGGVGGLFMLKSSAVAFAHDQGGTAGCAMIFPSERIELDLENAGNQLARYLAQLLRLGSLCWMIRRGS